MLDIQYLYIYVFVYISIYIYIFVYTHSNPLFIGWTSISSTFLSNPKKRCITWSTAGGLGTSPSKRYDHSSKTRASQTSRGRRCGCVWWADGEDGTGRGRWESYLIECPVKHQIMGIWWIMALVGEELGIAWDYGKMNDLWFNCQKWGDYGDTIAIKGIECPYSLVNWQFAMEHHIFLIGKSWNGLVLIAVQFTRG